MSAQKVRAGYEEWKTKMAAVNPTARGAAFLEMLKENRDRVNQQIEPFEAGTSSAYHPQIVLRVNSLQMLYAGRWIASSKADFSLPLKMIADDPAFRERRKLEVE